ncbi:uncharacterized protein LOC127862447 [Dreissena polymorpha]|uniref:RING-type domain-containing protein n=1 Tax=Dreissena polymorpha TaxID=45954 RepID=A0A9D3YHE7_DREPO|nr:uncharacterized protein LOC127862447 [Dreissena polymorpha]XP_052257528.1 uncharacterized protein LOC127862447 [Dreissena polymorpha]KAH3698655.1 hypothetical protein DPMN_086200 [Dreissena polymorpha]
MNRTTKIRITELNPHVICVLCGGYFVNATTITECLHSFCRTCITRYLETSKYCPVCDVMVHKTKPLNYIRADKTLQDLVYKLVPGLYRSEMKRRREYYAHVDPPGVTRPPSEDRGDEFYDRIIYTEDERISLSLELCAEGIPFKTPTSVHGHAGAASIKVRDVRYLQCPAAFSVGNLKKFIRMKFDLQQKYEMDIFHTAEPLPDYYTLMDIAYIYTWTRRTPLRLYYTVFERSTAYRDHPGHIDVKRALNSDAEITTETTELLGDATDIDQGVKETDKLPLCLLTGPDDISPDLDLEEGVPQKGKKRKRGTKAKVKKLLSVSDDDSVKEQMSESEEQLAKLRLDCGSDSETIIPDFDNENNVDCANSASVVGNSHSQSNGLVRSKGNCNKLGDRASERTDTLDAHRSERADKLDASEEDGDESDSEPRLVVDTDHDPSKPSSTQSSPSSSVHLTMFQPLTENSLSDNCNDESAKKESVVRIANGKNAKSWDSLVTSVPKRSKGRPKGSKNKVKSLLAVTKNAGKSVVVKQVSNVSKDIELNQKSKMNTEIVYSFSADENLNADQKKGNNVQRSVSAFDGSEQSLVKRKYVRKKKMPSEREHAVPLKRAKTVNAMLKCKDASGGVNGKDTLADIDISKPIDIRKTVSEGEGVVQVSNGGETGLNNCSPDDNDVAQDGKTLLPSAFSEPITPLYGETPNVNESNQGLPCSPNMDIKGNQSSNVEQDVIKDKPCDFNGAISNGAYVDNAEVLNTLESGLSSGIQNNFGIRSSFMFPTSMQPAFIGYNGNLVAMNALRPDFSPGHFNFANTIAGTIPPNALCIINGFSPSPLNAHAQLNHLTNGNTVTNVNAGYQSCDHHVEQPLDLTNNFSREEYTKGKIFKTKLLKRPVPKSDITQNGRDKHTMQDSQF